MKINKLNTTLEAAGIEAGDTINEIYFALDGVRIGITTGRGRTDWANGLQGVKVAPEKLLALVEEAYKAKLEKETAEKATAEKATAEKATAEKAAEAPKP